MLSRFQGVQIPEESGSLYAEKFGIYAQNMKVHRVST
jgi:hypothetical protein